MGDEAGLSRHSALHRRLVLPATRVVASLLLKLLGPVRVKGAYRVPTTGGLLILSNHLSDIDPIIVQYGCPRPVHFMAKSDLWNIRGLGPIMSFFGAFPIKRGEPDRQALRQAASLVKSGEAVVIFPEGQLSETGELQPIRAGVSLIARLTEGVPMLCVGLVGTAKIIPYGQIIPRPAFGGVTATWGEVRQFEKGTPTEEILSWIEGQFRGLGDYPET